MSPSSSSISRPSTIRQLPSALSISALLLVLFPTARYLPSALATADRCKKPKSPQFTAIRALRSPTPTNVPLALVSLPQLSSLPWLPVVTRKAGNRLPASPRLFWPLALTTLSPACPSRFSSVENHNSWLSQGPSKVSDICRGRFF